MGCSTRPIYLQGMGRKWQPETGEGIEESNRDTNSNGLIVGACSMTLVVGFERWCMWESDSTSNCKCGIVCGLE